MSKETKEEIIAILSEMRSSYNCFDANEEPKYRALSVAIKAIDDEPTVPTKGDRIAKQILADIAGMSVDDDLHAICNRIIFGKDQNDEHIIGKWELPKVSYHDWEEDRR